MQDECVQLGPFRYRNLVQRQVTILRNIYPYFTDEVISRIVMPLVQQDCGISRAPWTGSSQTIRKVEPRAHE